MRTRSYKPSDASFVAAIHAERGFVCEIPDLASPEWESVLVGVDDQDQPVMVLGARKTVEVVMWASPDWQTPGVRMAMFRELYFGMRGLLSAKGYRSACAWLAPSVVKTFGSRLRRTFGWVKSPWECWETGW